MKRLWEPLPLSREAELSLQFVWLKQSCLECFRCPLFFLAFLDSLCGHAIPSRLPCLRTVCRVCKMSKSPRTATRSWLLCTSIISIFHVSTYCTSPIRCVSPAHLGLVGVLLQLSNAKFVFRDTNMRLKYTQKEAVGTDMASVVVTVDEDYDLMHGPEV